MGLTVNRIARLKPGRYGDGHGLYLQIISKTNRSWLLRYERGGRERWMGLGPLHTYDLQQARERARKARQQLFDGTDPLDARKAERAARALEAARAITFEKATIAYHDGHAPQWGSRKYVEGVLSTLKRYAFPQLGGLPVASIDTGLVLKAVEPIWHEKPVTADRVRNQIERVLDWAYTRGYRTGDNPARWRGHLETVLPSPQKLRSKKHLPALPWAELPTFWAELCKQQGVAARALQFTILTAARTGEVINAVWDEIDFKAGTWTIPAVRMKAHREHRVPLSDAALELLKALPREATNKFVFVGPRKDGLKALAMPRVLARMGRRDIVVHGFRSTFRDWAAEVTSAPNHVVEQALAHTIGNAVEKAYRRGDLLAKRTRLMADWAHYTTAPSKANSKVVPMRGRK
jgi:integrase